MVSGNQIQEKGMTQLEPRSELAYQHWVQRASVHTQKAGSEKLLLVEPVAADLLPTGKTVQVSTLWTSSRRLLPQQLTCFSRTCNGQEHVIALFHILLETE